MRKLDTFFQTAKIQSTTSLSSPMSISTIPSTPSISSIPSTEGIANLHRCLEEANRQCSIAKSSKVNSQIFTYDYLRFLSICRFIQLLLDGESKIDASNQIAQSIWNKTDYMA